MKDKHIIARTNHSLKHITQLRLKHICGITPSKAYWRLKEGLGLITISDKESLIVIKSIIGKLSKVERLVQTEDKRKVLISFIGGLRTYQSNIQRGKNPIYLWDYCSLGNVEYNLILPIIDEWEKNGRLDETGCIHKILLKARRIKDTMESELSAEQTRIFHIKSNKVPLDSVWMIRTDFENKTSNTKNIRSLLDGIWDVDSQINEETKELLTDLDIFLTKSMSRNEFEGNGCLIKISDNLSRIGVQI